MEKALFGRLRDDCGSYVSTRSPYDCCQNSSAQPKRTLLSLWSLPGPQPDICLSGSCQQDIYPRGICRLAQPLAEAEAVGGRQQLLFPRRPEKQGRGSRTSTSKSPHCENHVAQNLRR